LKNSLNKFLKAGAYLAKQRSRKEYHQTGSPVKAIDQICATTQARFPTWGSGKLPAQKRLKKNFKQNFILQDWASIFSHIPAIAQEKVTEKEREKGKSTSLVNLNDLQI